MANNPSISFPPWMLDEVDARRRNTARSEWLQEAAHARLEAEDAGEWTTPEIDPASVVARRDEIEAVPDGGSDE